jgi:hypothetical protein
MRIFAMNIHACPDSMDHSKSLAGLRHLPSHAKVPSTTHRRGRTSKPLALSDRLTISIVNFRSFAGRLAISALHSRHREATASAWVWIQDGRHAGANQQAKRVDDDVPLTALLIAGIEATNSAASGGFHALLSTTPADRLASRPSRPRSHDQLMLMARSNPSSRQRSSICA